MNMGEQQKLLERLRKAVDERHTYHMQGGQQRHDGDFAEELIKQFFNMTVEHSAPSRETLEAAAEDGIALGMQIANLEGQLVDEQRKSKGYASECRDVEQYLGQALGYPWYRDDPKNFPECTDADGVCVGEHTPATIAAEGAQRIVEMRAKIKELEHIASEKEVLQLQFDEVCRQRDQARDQQISIMDFDYPPVAQQGAPNHEVLDLLTADDVNRWIQRILALETANEGLNNELYSVRTKMNNAYTSLDRTMETNQSTIDEVNHRATYRENRIQQLENCVRWALRQIVYSRANPLVPTVADRANSMFNHLFPKMETSPGDSNYETFSQRMYAGGGPRSGRITAGMDMARQDDQIDAMTYMMNPDGTRRRRR